MAIVGRPNAGKSSLFNQLAGAGRAIVTPVAGTTRDLLTERVDIDGIPITLVDTAGLRGGDVDVVEAEGMSRARSARSVADVTLVVLDGSTPLTPDDTELLAATASSTRLIAVNKSDLAPAWRPQEVPIAGAVAVSALTGSGVPALRASLAAGLSGGDTRRDPPAITNVRHANLLRRARSALARARASARDGVPEEFVASDVADARASLEQVTGARTTDDVLQAIFARFCIGK